VCELKVVVKMSRDWLFVGEEKEKGLESTLKPRESDLILYVSSRPCVLRDDERETRLALPARDHVSVHKVNKLIETHFSAALCVLILESLSPRRLATRQSSDRTADHQPRPRWRSTKP
jgi:hypothetical protein